MKRSDEVMYTQLGECRSPPAAEGAIACTASNGTRRSARLTSAAAPVVALTLLALLLQACSAPAPRHSPSRTPKPAAASVPAAPAPATASKGDADQRFREALKLMKAQQNAEATEAFLALSRDFPQYSGPFTDLGILYAQGRQRDQAIASFSKAVAANPGNAVALNWLGSLYREGGDFARAEQSWLAALAVKPDYAPVHRNLGILYDVSLRRPQQAVAAYREYLKYAGMEDLIVSAWIKELETAAPVVRAGVAP